LISKRLSIVAAANREQANEQIHRGRRGSAATLSVAGCGDQANGKAKDDKAETAAIPVEVRDPKLGEMLAVYAGTATLEADGEAVVVAKVGGEVKRILVEEARACAKARCSRCSTVTNCDCNSSSPGQPAEA